MKLVLMLSAALLAAFVSLSSAPAATEYLLVTADGATTYTNPVWSPDGRSIAYVSVSSVGDPVVVKTSVNVAALAGGKWKHRTLVQDADRPVWSPDGKRIAVWMSQGPAVVDVATGKAYPIYKGATYYPLAWSSSGRYLLLVPGATCPDKPLVRDMKTAKVSTVSLAQAAAWTSGGKLLTASSAPEGSVEPSLLRITDPATGGFRTVVKGRYVDSIFSPKGSGYAWVRMRKDAPKGEGIYRIDLKTGSILKMIGVRAEELYFSPDAKQFAFFGKWAENSSMEPQINVYLGNTQNWYFKVISKGAMTPTGSPDDRPRYVSWSPDSKSIAYVTKTGDIRVVKL